MNFKVLFGNLLFLLFASTSPLFSQQTINATITHDSLTREYILYVPEIYNSADAVPLVFNFHGYTSTAAQQMFYGDFREIADRENFIIAHPMGTLDANNDPFFNAQWVPGGVDDIGYTSALIDSISNNWNIDQSRIYSSGMSNGGFMSYTLACELSDRIAAIASVTGTCTIDQLQTSCQPEHLTPIMEIHGTSDFVVPYGGNTWMAPVESVIDFWVDGNGCEQTPIITQVEDTDTSDGSTVEHYVYKNGLEGNEVEHYKILGGGHTWPGTFFGSANQDINASELIWEFFSQYDINGKLLSNAKDVSIQPKITVFPNPSSGKIYLEIPSTLIIDKLTLLDINGKVVSLMSNPKERLITLDHQVPSGVYVLHLSAADFIHTQKIIIK